MPVPTYICIDDDAGQSNALVAALTASRLIKIRSEQPIEAAEQVKAIVNADYDGVILDLRLDIKLNAQKYRVDYTSNTIAQGMRDKVTLDNKRDVPIVLWSSQAKFKGFYDIEQTGHDLYDHTIVKTRVRSDVRGVATELQALATGYRTISALHEKGRSGFFEMLGIDRATGDQLDPRIGAQFDDNDEIKKSPPHRFARFIFTELIHQPYPLVDETLLAARLGVDLSSAGWKRLRRQFELSRYKGVFGDAWQRWWWDATAETIKARTGMSPRAFRSLTADERVGRVKAGFDVDRLRPASPIIAAYSSSFWSVCDGLDKPLDPSDGFVSSWSSREGWHDRRFISLKAAVERKKLGEGLRVHPLDRARFEQVMGASKRGAKA